MPLLAQIRPHKSDPVELILFYVRSLLHISTYASVLSSDLLSLVVDLVIQMDVNSFDVDRHSSGRPRG
jgi:hypothetical protein